MEKEHSQARATQEHLDWRLVEACKAGALSKIREALRLGADPNAWGYGGTALSWASTLESPEALKALLLAGADPSGGRGERDPSSPSLWNAGRFGREKALRILLEAGVDPNGCLPGERGTAGHMAAALMNPSMIEALLAAGWDPRRKGEDGRTPREIAQAIGRMEMADRLLRAEEERCLAKAASEVARKDRKPGL